MADLPINTTACAHAHLQPIFDLVKAEYPNASVQVEPRTDPLGGRNSSTGITFTLGEDEIGLNVRAKLETPRYRSGDAVLVGYEIKKGQNIPYHAGDNRPAVLRKDGTFDYDKLAGLVISAKRSLDNARRSAAQRQANTDSVTAVLPQIKALTLPGINVTVTDRKDHPLELGLSLKFQCSPEDALELVRRVNDWHHNFRKD